MQEASDALSKTTDSDTVSTNPKHGAYVTTINGIYADPNLKQFWRLLDGTTLQPLLVGVRSFVPTNNEIILFNFTTWN